MCTDDDSQESSLTDNSFLENAVDGNIPSTSTDILPTSSDPMETESQDTQDESLSQSIIVETQASDIVWASSDEQNEGLESELSISEQESSSVEEDTVSEYSVQEDEGSDSTISESQEMSDDNSGHGGVVRTGNRRGRGRSTVGGVRGRRRGSNSRCGRGGLNSRIGYEENVPSTAVCMDIDDEGFLNTDCVSDANEFAPLRFPGPDLPPDADVSELALFQLYFDDIVLDRLVRCTNAYAEEKKDVKKYMYRRFKRKQLTKEEMMCFIGVLLLLSINNIRNYEQAWNPRSTQVYKIIVII